MPVDLNRLLGPGRGGSLTRPGSLTRILDGTRLLDEVEGVASASPGVRVVANEAMRKGPIYAGGRVAQLLGTGEGHSGLHMALASGESVGAGESGLLTALAAGGRGVPEAAGWLGKLKGLGGKVGGTLGLAGLAFALYEAANSAYEAGPGTRKDERIARMMGLQDSLGPIQQSLTADSEQQLSNQLGALKGTTGAMQRDSNTESIRNQQALMALVESRKDLLGQISETRGPSPMEVYLSLHQ